MAGPRYGVGEGGRWRAHVGAPSLLLLFPTSALLLLLSRLFSVVFSFVAFSYVAVGAGLLVARHSSLSFAGKKLSVAIFLLLFLLLLLLPWLLLLLSRKLQLPLRSTSLQDFLCSSAEFFQVGRGFESYNFCVNLYLKSSSLKPNKQIKGQLLHRLLALQTAARSDGSQVTIFLLISFASQCPLLPLAKMRSSIVWQKFLVF